MTVFYLHGYVLKLTFGNDKENPCCANCHKIHKHKTFLLSFAGDTKAFSFGKTNNSRDVNSYFCRSGKRRALGHRCLTI